MKNTSENIAEYRKKLAQYLKNIAPKANENELTELANVFELDEFSKKEMILEAGKFTDTAYYIVKGLVRIFYVKENKEITNWFIKENMIFMATYSVFTREPNYSSYEALEDTIVLKASYAKLEELYAKYHSIEHMGRKTIEAYYGIFMKKSFDLLFLSADERYNHFIKHHSDLLNRVPLRYIASYLGLTQETLSRLRAK